MQAINLNKYEYYAHDHRTRKAYRRLVDLRNQLALHQITFNKFVVEVERVIFNRIPQKDLKYLEDGITGGAYVTIIKELTRSIEGGSLYRLKTDLLTVY